MEYEQIKQFIEARKAFPVMQASQVVRELKVWGVTAEVKPKPTPTLEIGGGIVVPLYPDGDQVPMVDKHGNVLKYVFIRPDDYLVELDDIVEALN